MAGEQEDDQSFYDFLVDDSEVMASMPSGHLDFGSRPQQPTSVPNRTSDERQMPTGARHIPAMTSAPPPMALDMDQSRVVSRAHSGLDLHAQSAPTTLGYVRPGTNLGHQPVDWGIYGGIHHPNQFHVSPFSFEVPTGMHHVPAISQPHHIDPTLSYGADLVSPASIHGHTGHYGFGVHWNDGTSQDVGTPTLTSPTGPISNNPWLDPEDFQNEGDNTESPRSDQNLRSKRHKKSGRQCSDNTAGPSSGGEPPSPSYSQNSRASLGSKSTSIASTSTTSSRPSKLRSASRTSKNSFNKPNDSPEERRTRASHNLVEKQYRNRLNAQFESLLNALPEQLKNGETEESDTPVNFEDKRVSKGEVLEMARKHIQSLERERDQLEKEKNELMRNLQKLKESSSEIAGSPSRGTPIDFDTKMDDDNTARDAIKEEPEKEAEEEEKSTEKTSKEA